MARLPTRRSPSGGLKPGGSFKIGAAIVQLRAAIERAPDALSGLAFGPRVTVAAAALAQTALIQPGTLVNYGYRVRLPRGVDPAAWAHDAREKFPDAGWQIRTATEASPQLQRFIDRIGLFLSLVGITALLVGGIGIASAVAVFIEGRTRTIATTEIAQRIDAADLRHLCGADRHSRRGRDRSGWCWVRRCRSRPRRFSPGCCRCRCGCRSTRARSR